MATKTISMPPRRAIQTNLFRPPSRSSPSWDRLPDAVKTHVVEALAQVLLRASGAAPGHEEAGDD